MKIFDFDSNNRLKFNYELLLPDIQSQERKYTIIGIAIYIICLICSLIFMIDYNSSIINIIISIIAFLLIALPIISMTLLGVLYVTVTLIQLSLSLISISISSLYNYINGKISPKTCTHNKEDTIISTIVIGVIIALVVIIFITQFTR